MKNVTHMKKYCLLAIVLLLVCVSCKSKKEVLLTPEQKASVKEVYDKAKSIMKKNPEKSRLLFKEIMHLFPDSPYAGRAKLGIADTYFKQKDSGSLLMAASEYQEFVNLYPNSPDAVYAKYQIAMCYYKQMRKPERDQTSTDDAIKALESLIMAYPDTEEAKDAKTKITAARLNLARHYFAIGMSNFRLKAFRGAVTRFKQVLDNYPDFDRNDKLFYYTGLAYIQVREYDTAVSFFQRVMGSFPKSKYMGKAKKMIGTIDKLRITRPNMPPPVKETPEPEKAPETEGAQE